LLNYFSGILNCDSFSAVPLSITLFKMCCSIIIMGIFIQGVEVGWGIGGGDLGCGIGEHGVVEALYPRKPYSQHLIFYVTYE
jgi:hypothetical protein